MKKVLVYTIVLMAFCAPLFAGTYVHDMGTLTPIVKVGPNYVAQQLDLLIAPWGSGGPLGLVGAIDPVTKAPIVDDKTKLQVMELDFAPAMHAGLGSTTLKQLFQSATLVKCHFDRKAVCMEWCEENVSQPKSPLLSKDGIKTSWPLMYETNGTTFELTINYGTTKLAAHPGYGPSKQHTEIYKWKVVAETWTDLENAIELFWRLPAGQCELSMITSKKVHDGLLWYLNGTPNPFNPGVPPIKGFKKLAADLDRDGWNKLYADPVFGFKKYLEDRCWLGCCISTDPCVPGPDATIHMIIDTCAAPVASVLLTDLWEIGKKLTMFGEAP